MMRPGPMVLISVLAAGILSGCGRRLEPVTAPAPARLDEATVDMITNTGDYAARRHRVDAVDVALTRQCMHSAGFTWTGVADAPNPDTSANRATRLDYARRHGYGLSETPVAEKPATAGPPTDTGLRAALLGPADDLAELATPQGVAYTFPRRGCAAQSHIAVFGDLDTWARIMYLPQEFNLQLSSEAKADPRYAAKLKEWSICMAARHYSYVSPRDAVQKLTAAYSAMSRPLQQRRATEIKIATHDVRCDFQVRLSATALDLRREYAQRLDPADRAELARVSTLFHAVEQRGQALERSTAG